MSALFRPLRSGCVLYGRENRLVPTSDSASTSRRLLALLSLLQRPRDWPAPELAHRLRVSERTVRRDVDRLRELDYRVEATRGPDGGYRLGAGSVLPPLLLDDEQAVAMAIALRAAASTGVDIDEGADRALQTLARLMPTASPSGSRGSPPPHPAAPTPPAATSPTPRCCCASATPSEPFGSCASTTRLRAPTSGPTRRRGGSSRTTSS